MPNLAAPHDAAVSRYVLSVAAVEGADGDWACRVAYDELPGCEVVDSDPYAALDRLDALRHEIVTGLLLEGRPIPDPSCPT